MDWPLLDTIENEGAGLNTTMLLFDISFTRINATMGLQVNYNCKIH